MMLQFLAVSASHPLSSITWSQLTLSFLIAFFQSLVLSSSETERISNPLSRNFGYNFTSPLLATRQGPHQDAQKSSNTTLPFSDESRMVSPANEGKAISGASLPYRGWEKALPVVNKKR